MTRQNKKSSSWNPGKKRFKWTTLIMSGHPDLVGIKAGEDFHREKVAWKASDAYIATSNCQGIKKCRFRKSIFNPFSPSSRITFLCTNNTFYRLVIKKKKNYTEPRTHCCFMSLAFVEATHSMWDILGSLALKTLWRHPFQRSLPLLL